MNTNIPGLSCRSNYLTPTEIVNLLANIRAQPWEQSGRMRRLVQQYGFAYQHERPTDRPLPAARFPDWLTALADRLVADRHFPRRPDQAIINRYLPGEGITAHVDYTTYFGPVIASLSLGSTAVMEFTRVGNLQDKHVLWLEPGSLLVMSGEARYRWKHGIPARQRDELNERVSQRQERISVTFRMMC